MTSLSNPPGPASPGVGQPGSLRVLETRCRRFESDHPDQIQITIVDDLFYASSPSVPGLHLASPDLDSLMRDIPKAVAYLKEKNEVTTPMDIQVPQETATACAAKGEFDQLKDQLEELRAVLTDADQILFTTEERVFSFSDDDVAPTPDVPSRSGALGEIKDFIDYEIKRANGIRQTAQNLARL